MLWRQTKFFLCENDKIVNNTKDVTECFNNFFSTVANSIGKDGKNQAVSADTSYMKIKMHRLLLNSIYIYSKFV